MIKEFLTSKPLYYNEIDYTRMPRVYQSIKSNFSDSKIIHLIGTNAKGTTGRFLASALNSTGYKVGHYTSPHILEFNERIWLNGKDVSYSTLDEAHEKLQDILTKEDSDSLSYFEYTTFLAMLVFNGCDYIVLEAGLGGEHDATAVFAKKLTLVTPIDLDHEAFLGSNIEDIATTKLNAISKNAIIAFQKFEQVNDIAKEIASKSNARIYDTNELLDQQDIEKMEIISKKLDLAEYLKDNLRLSISALKFLECEYEIDDFIGAKLFGRLSKINNNIYVDVGHNPLAARSIEKALTGGKFILIYNSYKDKDYKEILSILKPLIIHVEIIDIEDERIESINLLQTTLNDLKIKYEIHKEISEDSKYLVFGSFSVVEAFLREYYE